MYTTIMDLHAAVLQSRPDVAAAGVTITPDHVLAARHERGVRYEDITDADLDAITERSLELAERDHLRAAAAALGRMGRGEAKRRGDSDHYRALAARRKTHGRQKPTDEQ